MLTDQIFYFIIVIGVLVTVHEFGHFIAARLCGMRTDVFSIGFGMRLFGFNKRSGFTFRETPPNSITLPLEALGGTNTVLDAAVVDELERVSRDFVAGTGGEVIEFLYDRPIDAGSASMTVTFAVSKRFAACKSDAEALRRIINGVLAAHAIIARAGEPVCSFSGVGVCDYRLALLPLGGYVKIAGMVDESMDTGFAHRDVQPWEFRAHPAWQRIIVISGGVAMNAILAAFLFIGLRHSAGEEIWQTRTVGIVVPNSLAAQAGMNVGDEITSVNGVAVTNWQDMYSHAIDGLNHGDVHIDVRRAGTSQHLLLGPDPLSIAAESPVQRLGIYPEHSAPIVLDVNDGLPASKAGMRANDVVVRADTNPVETDEDLKAVIRAHAGRPLSIAVKRADGLHQLTVVPSDSGRVGIAIANVFLGPRDTVYSFSKAVSAGLRDEGNNFAALGKMFKNLIMGQASVKDNLGGPIAIAKMAGRTAELGISYLFLLMASLSVSLAALNILPVPALDGGHLLFIIVETIIRREVPNKVKIVVQQAGFALLLLLMAFVVFNDLRR